MKLWIIGVKKLVVKVNAQYIKEMLNKLDLYSNVAINKWIATILMFDFELVHVLRTKHKRPDGLSRKRVTKDEEGDKDVEEAKNWMNEIIGCRVWVASKQNKRDERLALSIGESI